MFQQLLRSFPQSDDSIVLDEAIDWYNRGVSSRNPFTAFLCYYVAIEGIANAVAEEDTDLGLRYTTEPPRERRALRVISCTDRCEIGSAMKWISPDVGFSLPVMRLKSVVLPAPFGPTRQRSSPGSRVKSRLLVAVRPPNRLVSDLVSRIGDMSR